MDDEDLLESHPDLLDPAWRRQAEAGARRGAKKDRKNGRKRFRTQRRGSRRWVVAAVVLILGVTATAIVLTGREPASSVAAPDPTSVPAYAHVDLAHPFANTPADTWTKYIDGITSPEPATTGSFPPEAVAHAYLQVRSAIIRARLDPAVLTGHDPKAYVALFAPDQRARLTKLFSAGPTKSTAGFVTEIADGYHLLDAGPRTFGTLTARPGDQAGELTVDARYVIAYAFDDPHPAGLTSPDQIDSFLRVDETYVLRNGPAFAESSQGLWVDGGRTAFSSVGCAAAQHGYLAPGYTNPPALRGTRHDAGYYDPNYTLPSFDECPKS
ncbi:hypothetical protein [Amycolatopsis sp. FDAARGOS 1241]|uniref:hypothetical protein n=1 Tax=Amycolatopsis sp. FDAARGOS 1241 TaxID=2778070 RepID=UPI0019505AF8|nr:hypothetical protein [Amycolatopsis sp. FDAARGOS 1241]QRP49778.1 hypothetical protein I6J71_19770 [Amycolatopsis sp. FDAARGOS 1241]